MDLTRHEMEAWDKEELVERLFKKDQFIDDMEKRHYQQVYKEVTASRDDEEEPILRRIDGTPFLLNVFSYEDLLEVKPLFLAEPEGRMSKDRFRDLLAMFGGRLKLTHLQFERIFLMIDIDLDEVITWNDFMTFLDQEQKEQEILANGVSSGLSEVPIQGSPNYIRNKSGHLISSIAFWPGLTKDKKLDYSAGRFVTTSKDGYVDFFNLDMKHLISATAFSAIPLKIAHTCITKIVPMPDINMVCVCTMDREVRIYDAISENFRLRTVMNDFRQGLVAMTYHFYDTDSIHSWIAVGDTQGNIIVLSFSPNSARTLFAQVIGLPFISIRLPQILMGAMPGLHAKCYPNVHPGWIESMAYYEEYKCLVTTCNSPTNSVVLLNVFSNAILAKVDLACGVICAASLSRGRDEPWAELGVFTKEALKKKESPFSHYLVTAGFDFDIRIWDLDVTNRPKYVIEGSTSRILLLIVEEESQATTLIYTYAWEGIITVWDARSRACLQVYKENLDKFGTHTQLALCYNSFYKMLVVGAFKLCCLKIGKTFNKDYTSGSCHDREITVALYNYLFDVVVTASAGSVVTKWHALTGTKMFSWSHAHSIETLRDVISYGITTGTFNSEQSLLATGAVDGSIKVWNFHTGTCLKRLEMGKGAVLRLIWLKTKFFGIGMESSYREWESKLDSEAMKELPKKWKRTLSAGCFVPPVTIVIGDVFGELLFCNFSSGTVYKRYYVHEPFKNLTMDVDYEAEQKSSRNLVFDKRRHYNVGGVATTAIHDIFYLRKRRQEKKEGSVLVALDTGMIQVWSAHPKGGLVCSFYAAHKADDYVVRMMPDVNNDYLFTGSSEGYLKLWLLQNFATSDHSSLCLPRLRLQYAFLANTRWNTRAKRGVAGQSLPLLLNSYRAHGMAINSIIFVDFCQLVITAGCDKSVRYWSMTGQFLNQLGSILPWITVDPTKTVVVKKLRIPTDLKRVMSSTTMKVLTNGYRLTEEGEKDLISPEIKATAHIHRRKTSRRPHGQRLGLQVWNQLKVPDTSTKPALPPPKVDTLDVLGHLEPCKMERVEMIEVPQVLQRKVKKIFMDSLQHAGVPAYKKNGELKIRETDRLENLMKKTKMDRLEKKMEALLEEDVHHYVNDCKVRDAVAEPAIGPKVMEMIGQGWKENYFEEPLGKYLWSMKRFEKDTDLQLRGERMKDMAHRLREDKRMREERQLMKNDIERSRVYLSKNLLNNRTRIGRIKNTINRLKKMEETMAKVVGSDEEAESRREDITRKVGKLQAAALHDFTIQHKRALGKNFWKPLYTSEESDVNDDN